MAAVRPNSTAPTPEQNFLQESTQRIDLIEQLLAIGTALSGTYQLEELLNLILTKSREITCSDAGSVYLIDRSDPAPHLQFKVAQNASLPSLSFREFAVPLSPNSLAGYVALTGTSLNIPDAYNLPEGVPYQIDRSFDQNTGYRTCSVLVLPMQNQERETIGVLQLINRKVKADILLTDANALAITQPYSDLEERILRSLASQAAISIERTHLQESIENLFEGFVRASVQIIETRDPCTSGHSERVAALTVCLGEEINTLSAGPLRTITFNQRQLQEIRYAALLHDFGKVGVPEAILGKQKKLYPMQLDVIRHRFTIARRTLELDCAQAKLKSVLHHNHLLSGDDASDCPGCQLFQQLDSQLGDRLEQLDQYWQLLLEANEPRILGHEPLVSLEKLAQYTYRDESGQLKPLVTPEEMAQLMVPRGNLTHQERQFIETHVVHTYEFLKRIPWTRHLQQVPVIAAGHHEKLDGSGYPRGLKQEDIPVQAQIMAIADIYDALTAGDRPYKRRVSVQGALQILYQEAQRHKVNQDLVELFDQRQVFRVLHHQIDA